MTYTGQKNLYQERHGEGHYFYENTFFKYHGSYFHNKKDGYGVLEMADGSSVEGEFVNGEICGKGLRRYPNGSTYQGEFKNGERFGYGIFYGSNNLETIRGNWIWNKLEGEATCSLRNQDQIKGVYKQHLLHGNDIVYSFLNGKAVYEGSFVDGKFHGNGTYQSHRSFDDEISHHYALPAGTSLPQFSILTRSFWRQTYQPIQENYCGQWSKGKRHGFGKWEIHFVSRRQADNSSNNDEVQPNVMIVEDEWINDEPKHHLTNIIVLDSSQPSKWRLQPLISDTNISISSQQGPNQSTDQSNSQINGKASPPNDQSSQLESSQANVIIVPDFKSVSIPQYTVKLNAPKLKFIVLLCQKQTKATSITLQDSTPPSKDKKEIQSSSGLSEEVIEYIQCNTEIGRLLSCKIYRIPETFVKKKPGKGESLEEISTFKLPSEREPMGRVEGIPHIFQISTRKPHSNSLPGTYGEVEFNFSKLTPGYYALQFKNATMTTGIGKIQDFIVYVQIVK